AFVRFLDTGSFTVGAVGCAVCAAGATGVTTTDSAAAPFANDIDLVSQAGSLTLANAVNAGSATVRLNAATAVTQTAGGAGAVTGGSLAVLANGNIDLCEVANTVSGTFAASDTGAGAFVRFLDTGSFTVGAV